MDTLIKLYQLSLTSTNPILDFPYEGVTVVNGGNSVKIQQNGVTILGVGDVISFSANMVSNGNISIVGDIDDANIYTKSETNTTNQTDFNPNSEISLSVKRYITDRRSGFLNTSATNRTNLPKEEIKLIHIFF